MFRDFTFFNYCLLVGGCKTDAFSPRIILGDQSAGKPKQVLQCIGRFRGQFGIPEGDHTGTARVGGSDDKGKAETE